MKHQLTKEDLKQLKTEYSELSLNSGLLHSEVVNLLVDLTYPPGDTPLTLEEVKHMTAKCLVKQTELISKFNILCGKVLYSGEVPTDFGVPKKVDNEEFTKCISHAKFEDSQNANMGA